MSIDYNWPELAEAKKMGLSYGKYKALMYITNKAAPPKAAGLRKTDRRKQKKYSDHAAFRLWQQGKLDAEIAAELGVCRSLVQKWRETLELPSTARKAVDTKKYRLCKMEDGTFFAIFEDNQTISAKLIEKEKKR